MRQPLADSRRPEWQILSTYVRLQDGPRRVARPFRLLLGPARSPEAPPPTEGRSDDAVLVYRYLDLLFHSTAFYRPARPALPDCRGRSRTARPETASRARKL
jgi:hypothetical protein